MDMRLPQDTLDFLLRWQKKNKHYDYNNLVNCFDGFFTAFVLYNLLYDLLCSQNGPNYNIKGNEERAIKAARKYLGASTIAADEDIRSNASVIRRLIESRTFYIRDHIWDAARIEKLRTGDPEQWSIGVLEIVYKIRCNLFHGQKSFQENQREILIPCIKILERINDLIIERIALL